MIGLAVCAALIESGLVMVLGLERPASYVPEFIAYYLLISISYVTACWLVVRDAGQSLGPTAVRFVWAAALVFRLTVAPLDPSLSEDSVRYRWLGMLQDAGGDPYRDLPEDPEWAGLRDDTWPRVTGKDKPSAYGPVVEQVNVWFYRLIRTATPDPWIQVWLFKVPFAVADLLVGLVLMALLSSAGKPGTWALVYLWSPLPVVEFWIEGHNDALAVLFVVLALALARRDRPHSALAFLAVATMCKFWPAILLPFLALTRRRQRWIVQWKGVLAFAMVAVALCLPYWDSVIAVLDILDGFTGRWRNNDSVFGLFLKLAGGDMEVAGDISKWTVLAAVVVVRFLPLRPLAGELAAVCVVLLASANCLPWYLTWMLPLLAVHPTAPLLLWSALVSLAYHVVPEYEANNMWRYDPSLIRMEYAPVLVWFVALAGRRLRNLLPRDSARKIGN